MNKRRVSDLHNDDPNDLFGQCVYMPEDVEPEITRLRERVAELECGPPQPCLHYLANKELEERERLLREALQRIGDVNQRYSTDADADTQLHERIADALAALEGGDKCCGLFADTDPRTNPRCSEYPNCRCGGHGLQYRERLLLESVRRAHKQLLRYSEADPVAQELAPLIAEATK
jgi:hypothetical protein